MMAIFTGSYNYGSKSSGLQTGQGSGLGGNETFGLWYLL